MYIFICTYLLTKCRYRYRYRDISLTLYRYCIEIAKAITKHHYTVAPLTAARASQHWANTVTVADLVLRQFPFLAAYSFQCKVSGGHTRVLGYSIKYSIESSIQAANYYSIVAAVVVRRRLIIDLRSTCAGRSRYIAFGGFCVSLIRAD